MSAGGIVGRIKDTLRNTSFVFGVKPQGVRQIFRK